MSKYKGEELSNLSVEELLNLTVDDIEKLTGRRAPVGAYSGLMVGLEMPNPAEDKNYIEVLIRPTAVIELQEPTDENTAAAAGYCSSDKPSSYRYYTNKGFGIQKFNTDFEEVIRGLIDNRPLGELFAAFAEGAEVPINFLVKHRTDRNDKSKVYEEISDVTLAG